ncbi:hypothetical protein FE697_005600 [Mumia zhuanghuii]|uniref:Uncharacterized protein n=2 Tax=Mumia TaxID=1546255 RepID=A0ABW1QGS7_9ACTN|nr:MULTISPECIES: hypothetical protein [Mumia]KAA1425329.1 hypothetical protein FE697_005600 [Mumia zhuanghuii]
MSRIREEARSPLGLTSIAPSVMTCLVAGLLVLAALAGPFAVAAAVLVAQLTLAAVPSPTGISRTPVRAPKAAPIAVAGIVASLVTLAPALVVGADGTRATASADVASGSLVGVGLALPVLVLTALFGQLRRPAPRPDVVLALGEVVVTGTIALLATGWVAAAISPVGRPAVIVAAVVTAVVVLADRAERIRPLALVWALALGALTGIVLAALEDANSVVGGVAAVAIGGAAALGGAVGRRWRPLPPNRWAVEAVAPIAFAGPVVFIASLLWAGL